MRQLPAFSAQSEEKDRIKIIIKEITKQILTLDYKFNDIDKIVINYTSGKKEITMDEIGIFLNAFEKLIPNNDLFFGVGSDKKYNDNLLNVSVLILYKSIDNDELFDFYNQLITSNVEQVVVASPEDIFSKKQLDFIQEFKDKTNLKSVILSEDSRIVINEVNKRLIRDLAKTPDLMYKLTSRQFEELVAELFVQEGYEVELTKSTVDGGKDIYAAKTTVFGQFLYVVECKKYSPENKVGVNVLRSLYGVVQNEKVTSGIIVTSSYFTKNARNFQQNIKHQLQLNDFNNLCKWLEPNLIY
ncbi:restriction endonuclease [Chryseobacterium aurantiacum]|uniref:restriction endonuclease n=1 Tax=Chryseobacterium aurantiacum TaxID=2116499 RepID=UPI000D129594|nr:restriction endonuclease [Chryseobacterium aurantiacum]